MAALPLRDSSEWSSNEIERFLEGQEIPMRLSCNGKDGFPMVCSLWYVYHNGYIWGATHEQAAVAKMLEHDNKCAFEVAPNEMPYRGVRGQGTVELLRPDAAKVLGELIERYLHSRQSKLAQWLMSRTEHEYAIKIKPAWMTSWDFSERMGS